MAWPGKMKSTVRITRVIATIRNTITAAIVFSVCSF